MPAGWSNTITVCAYVVNIRDVAAADKCGLLQPLLKRWQAGGLSYAAFALPAVQAVIGEGRAGQASEQASEKLAKAFVQEVVYLRVNGYDAGQTCCRVHDLLVLQTGSGAASVGACCSGSWPSS